MCDSRYQAAFFIPVYTHFNELSESWWHCGVYYIFTDKYSLLFIDAIRIEIGQIIQSMCSYFIHFNCNKIIFVTNRYFVNEIHEKSSLKGIFLSYFTLGINIKNQTTTHKKKLHKKKDEIYLRLVLKSTANYLPVRLQMSML